ncbi:uncharacterized protein LOC126199182 [Schistocerca nitens]|uniref:uncharacterized protein LOC126199182 n=1 Tax=Schistocerca nitens TaxID=7011 RepID=UPI0021176B8E|nr:uncharacterized protein LOC126199182 [Schistocerca nitens]
MENIPWTEPVTSSKFEDLLGLNKGSVESISIKNMTKPGQNFGSSLLSIEVTLRDGQTLYLVGKFMPRTEAQKAAFDSAKTFVKEIHAYRSINVELIKLQRERGVPEEEVCDPMPRYYGSRVNIADDDSSGADDNAVLLLQNLTRSGYQMRDQKKGLDLSHARLLVKRVAQFQASAVALRLLKPQVFSSLIDGRCTFAGMGAEGNRQFSNSLMEHFKSFPEVAPYYDRLRAINDRVCDISLEKLWAEVVEPYASLSHNDLWVNNMMFLYDVSGNPTSVKFFDFQTLTYSSPVRDLIFFLYTSVRHDLVRNSVDELTVLYYESFVVWLKKMGCSTEAFTETAFRQEIDRVAPTEVMHILLLLNVLCADEHEKFTPSDEPDSSPSFSSSEMYRTKALITLQDFDARGWL